MKLRVSVSLPLPVPAPSFQGSGQEPVVSLILFLLHSILNTRTSPAVSACRTQPESDHSLSLPCTSPMPACPAMASSLLSLYPVLSLHLPPTPPSFSQFDVHSKIELWAGSMESSHILPALHLFSAQQSYLKKNKINYYVKTFPIETAEWLFISLRIKS